MAAPDFADPPGELLRLATQAAPCSVAAIRKVRRPMTKLLLAAS
jgi:hypothetical protein